MTAKFGATFNALGLYQIHIYDLTNRKYTREPCVEVQEDVKADYQSLSHGAAVTVSVGVNTKEVGIKYSKRRKGRSTNKYC